MTHNATIKEAKRNLDDLQRACEDALALLEAGDIENKDEIAARAVDLFAQLSRLHESLKQIGSE